MNESVLELRKLDHMNEKDNERAALFNILGSELMKDKAKKLYDFENHSIRPDGIDYFWSKGEIYLAKLAFSLFNPWNECPNLDGLKDLDQENKVLAIESICIAYEIY